VKIKITLQVGNGAYGFSFNSNGGKGERFFGLLINHFSGNQYPLRPSRHAEPKENKHQE
jgi:hypothetical protein